MGDHKKVIVTEASRKGREGGDGARELGWGQFDSGGGRRPWSLEHKLNHVIHDLAYVGHLNGPFHSSDREKAQRGNMTCTQPISDRSKKRTLVFWFPVCMSC